MLRLLTHHARPGMTLALPIYHPRVPECVLLREGMELDSFSIPHLRDLGIPEVWIQYPGLEHLVKFVDPQLHAQFRELTARLGLVIDQALVAPIELDYYSCKRTLIATIRRLSENPSTALWTSEIAGADRPFVRHCGTVAGLAIMMGMKLDFYMVRERPRLPANRAKDLTSLGIGSLLHDIGVLHLLAESVANYNKNLDTNEPIWREHTAIGYEMTRGILDPSATTVVLHHHQAFDGSGWPHRLPKPGVKGPKGPVSGNDIHILARIAAAADLFDRLRNPAHAPGADPNTNPSRPIVQALHMMLEPQFGRLLDPIVRTALFSVAPPFPPGSLVTLSDGTDAVVVDWNPSNPCRPVVEFAERGQNDMLRPKKHQGKVRRLDLREAPELSIASMDGVDVRPWCFEPEFDGQFDINAIARQLSNRAHDDLKDDADKSLVTDDATLEMEQDLKRDAA
jgi:HD-GYP domain-containing protein (c-di-GMP phosphodiesterase class II)